MFGLTALQMFLVVIGVFVIIYWITPSKHIWFPFVFITVMFAVIAYNCSPDSSDDLAKYFKALNEIREEGKDGLDRYIEENQFDFKTFKAAAYYIYYLSKLDKNNWLPFTTMFIVYGLGFYCIYKAIKRFKIEKNNAFWGIMFFLCTYWYYDTCSGTRNGLAFAISFACSYQMMVERKHIPLCVIGFVIASLMHSSGIIPVVLAILAEITLNTSGKFLNGLLIFGILGGAAGIRFLASISNNDFIQRINDKVDGHEATLDGLDEEGTMFRVNVSVMVVVILLIIYFSYFIINYDYSKELKRFYKYSSIVAYFCVGAMFSGLIFVRFARWILPLIGALIYMIGMQMEDYYIEDKTLTYCRFFSPINISYRVQIKSIVTILYVIFMAVHMWYMCTGSSLIWLHFESEL